MRADWLLGLWGLLLLALFNSAVFEKEQLEREGRPILLELVPVDPRSIMQGDYMRLRYRLQGELGGKPLPGKRLIMRADENGIATFERIDDGRPLPEGCFYLKQKRHADRFSIGADTFFFQAGCAHRYERAAYGELVVDEEGNTLLIGLRDKDLEPLGR